MDLLNDDKSKLLELLKKEGKILPNEKTKIAEKIEKMTDSQIGGLLREIVDGHYDISDIENEIEDAEQSDEPAQEEKEDDKGDYSRKGEITAMRRIAENEPKTAEEELEIAPDDIQ